jgi:hypothetical protein
MKIQRKVLAILTLTRQTLDAMRKVRMEYINSARTPADNLMATVQLEAIDSYTEEQLYVITGTHPHSKQTGGTIPPINNKDNKHES